MKNLKTLLVIAGIAVLASCATPSSKAIGSYNGTAVVGSNSYSGTVSVTANGDNAVNILATANSTSYAANNVTATLSNDVVSLTYTSSTTVTNEITALSGTVTGNSINLVLTIMVFNPVTTGATFTGTK